MATVLIAGSRVVTLVESEDDARAIAEAMLDQHVRPLIREPVITTTVRLFPTCWVVGFNTRAYVETGAINHALAGGGPIIVNRRTGVARIGTSTKRIEEQLDPE